MKIGLIDVDGHNFPNLALMKISAWHKAQGDSVEWYEPMFSGHMDKVYMSKVFTFTPDYEWCIDADIIERGGTGYKDYHKVLPIEIEYTNPDYSIYPSCDYAVGFLTRGCIRKCPRCVVPKKEGWIHPVATWSIIKRPDSKKILFLDNNVLACDHGRDQIAEMSGRKDIRIDFNQGLDARLIDPEMAKLLGNISWIRFLRMACDSSDQIPTVCNAIQMLTEHMSPSKIFIYVLVKDIKDALWRIDWLDRMGVEVFAQPYRDFDNGEVDREAKRLARWCNRKAIFRSVKWKDYR